MVLYEELYFEIKATGTKSEINKFISFLKSGEIDDFFEFSSDYVSYDDEYATAAPTEEVTVTISNDDYGLEIDEFDTDEFLELICKAAKNLFLKGQLYDIDDDEYSFVSNVGDTYYVNALKIEKFNEDDDKEEESDDED